jgi:hypothetical protein
VIHGAFVLDFLGAGESLGFLGILSSGGSECLGSAAGFGKAWKCFDCLNLGFFQRLGVLGVLGDGMAKALEGFVGLETAWLKLFLRT